MKKVLQRMLALCFAFTLCLGLFQTDVATVTVQAKTKTVGILISEKNTTLIKGQKHTLYVTGTKKKVSWSSTNKKVATVSKKGVVTAKKKGNAVIKAKVGKKTLKCKVKVTVVGLNYTTISLGKGDTKTLKLLNNKKKVTWKSKNKNICTVSAKGKLKARKKGNTVIYAKVGKKNYKCKVIVKDNVVKKKDKNGTYNFEYNPTVKKEELSKEKSYTVSQVNNELQISVKKDKATSSVKAGDVVVMPKNSNNEFAAMKVKAVVSQGNKLVYVGEAAEYTDVFEKIDIDSNKNFTFDGFECAPGIKENNANKKYASRRYNSSLSLNYDDVTVTISRESLKAEIKEGNTTGTIEVLKPSLNSDIDITVKNFKPNVKRAYFAVTQVCKKTVEFEGEASKEIFLGHKNIPIKDGFSVDLIFYLNLSASGEATITTKTTVTIGADYNNGILKNVSNRKVEFKKMEANGEAAVLFNPMVDLRWGGYWDEKEKEANLCVKIIRVGAEVGPKIKGDLHAYTTKPYTCLDVHFWLALSIYLDKDYGISGVICRIADVDPVWNILDDNSKNPFRKTMHLEDGKVVGCCSRLTPAQMIKDGSFPNLTTLVQTEAVKKSGSKGSEKYLITGDLYGAEVIPVSVYESLSEGDKWKGVFHTYTVGKAQEYEDDGGTAYCCPITDESGTEYYIYISIKRDRDGKVYDQSAKFTSVDEFGNYMRGTDSGSAKPFYAILSKPMYYPESSGVSPHIQNWYLIEKGKTYTVNADALLSDIWGDHSQTSTMAQVYSKNERFGYEGDFSLINGSSSPYSDQFNFEWICSFDSSGHINAMKSFGA